MRRLATLKWRLGALAVVLAAAVAVAVSIGLRTGPGASAADAGITEPGLLKRALELATKPGPIPRIEGMPTSIRGAAMTYGEARELLGRPMSPTASEYEHRDRPVFLFAFDGKVIVERGPGTEFGTPPTIHEHLRLVIDGETSNLLYGQAKSEPLASLLTLPVIELPANIDEVEARPTEAYAVATAAPPEAPETVD